MVAFITNCGSVVISGHRHEGHFRGVVVFGGTRRYWEVLGGARWPLGLGRCLIALP
jgi:hypothetical protein